MQFIIASEQSVCQDRRERALSLYDRKLEAFMGSHTERHLLRAD